MIVGLKEIIQSVYFKAMEGVKYVKKLPCVTKLNPKTCHAQRKIGAIIRNVYQGRQMKLRTKNEWIDITGNHLVALEQAQYQSMKYKVCVECFSKENLILKDKRALIKSTDYYLCKECDDYYNKKV